MMKISIKQIIILLIVGIPLSVLTYIGAKNYSGFCFAQNRYLTHDEKILIVFNHVNRATKMRIGGNGGKNYSDVKTIPYGSFEEFTKENPNCCEVDVKGRYGFEIPPPDFFDRITGYNANEIITINYKFHYINKNGRDNTHYIEGYQVLTNCGRVKY